MATKTALQYAPSLLSSPLRLTTTLTCQLYRLQKQKQQIRQQLETASKARDAVKTSLRDLKSNMKFTTVEAIDEAIEKLEERMQHSSLSLTEEKKVLEDIRKLKASRAAVGQYSEKLEALAQDDSTRADLQTSLKAADQELTSIKSQEETLRAELAELRAKEQETGNDVPALLQEREECREVCKQAYEKIKDLRAEHDVEWQEFKAADKLWRAQQDEDRARRREQAAAERAAREAERAARLAENQPEPFDREITMCEQLIAYLTRFQSAAQTTDDAGGATDAKPAAAALDGMKLLSRKSDKEDDEPWGKLATGTKRGKGKGRRAGAAGGEEVSEKLVHSIDILEAFATLKITVPVTAATLPATVTEVSAQKESFLVKREEAKAAKADGVGSTEATEASGVPGEKPNGAGTGEDAEEQDADAKKKQRKGEKKPAAAALKLDDESSWPAVGAPAAAAPAPAAAEENAEEEPAAAPEAEDKEETQAEAQPAKAEEEATAAEDEVADDQTAAANGHPQGKEEEAEEEEHQPDYEEGSEEGEISPSKPVKVAGASATSDSGVAVAFNVCDANGISVAITHTDE
jgi:uncharacterized coiled-coil DUF342 family protein